MKLLEIFKKKEPSIQVKNTVEDIVEVIEVKEKVEIVDSKVIQSDIKQSFDKVLEEFNLDPSKETQVENLNLKLNEFKDVNKEVYNKIELLKNLNLVNTPSVTKSLKQLETKESNIKKEISKIENELSNSKKIQELIANYNIKYPGYKFITTNVMIDIMKKYDLVLGESFMYSREIPDKSLSIISNFSEEIKKSENMLYLIEEVRRHMFDMEGYLSFSSEIPKSDINRHYKPLKQFKLTNFKMIAPMSHFTIPKCIRENRMGGFYDSPLFRLDLNTRMFKPDHNSLQEYNKTIKEVLDPIACLEVEGGYIIMDAWDKEADIPEIKNVNLN